MITAPLLDNNADFMRHIRYVFRLPDIMITRSSDPEAKLLQV